MRKNFIFYALVITIIFFLCCDETPSLLPIIVNFSASSTGVWHIGDKVTLSWSVQNADSVSIDNGIGPVPSSGTYIYTLTSPGSFNFVLTATNRFGTAERIMPYTVAAPQINEVWNKTFHGLYDSDSNDLIQCSNGDYLIVGHTSEWSKGYCEDSAMLIRTDAEGDKIWEKYYRRGDGCFGQSAVEMPDNSFIVAANNRYIYSNYSSVFLFYLIQISSTGDLFWEKNIGGYHWRAWDCVSSDDGHYLIAGESYNLNGKQGFRQLYLGKFNEFKPIWEKTYSADGPAINEASGRKLIKTSDGGYAVLGMNWSEEQGKDIFLIKTDNSGTFEWQKTIGKGAPVNEEGRDFVECDDGGFLIVGYTDEQNNGDIYVVKTDSAGNPEWETTYGGKWQDDPASIIKCSDGNFLVAWNTYEEPLWSNGKVGLNLLKINSAGKLFWQLYQEGVCSSIKSAEHIIESDEGDYLILSSALSPQCYPRLDSSTPPQKAWIKDHPLAYGPHLYSFIVLQKVRIY